MADSNRNDKVEAIAVLRTAMCAIKAARIATGKSAVCSAAAWEKFNVATSMALNEIAFLAQEIAPASPMFEPFTASSAEFELLTAR